MTRPRTISLRIAKGLRHHCHDNQADLLPRVRAEKARRALLADCERSPLNWETRHG